jgi:hypothetical protein
MKSLFLEKMDETDWVGLCKPHEISDRHITQLSTSGCGATAIVNILLLLDLITRDDIEQLNWDVCILRRRAEKETVFPYLLSRYDAGCTGEELIESMNLILKENNLSCQVNGKFYPFRECFFDQTVGSDRINDCSVVSEADVDSSEKTDLSSFVKENLQKSNILIATLNLQIIENDAWHHQIIYGMNEKSRLYHVMNPIDYYPEEIMKRFMSTDNVLLIRRMDVLKRLTQEQLSIFNSYYHSFLDPEKDHTTEKMNSCCYDFLSEGELLSIYGNPIFLQEPWRPFCLIDQIAELLHRPEMTHVMIPAVYEGGIAVFSKQQEADK